MERIAQYLALAKQLVGKFEDVQLTQIPRDENAHADALAKLASTNDAEFLGMIPVELLSTPSVPKEEQMEVGITDDQSWMTPLVKYLETGKLPEDRALAKKLTYKASQYILENGTLFKRCFNQPLLRCVNEQEAANILKEVHNGICGTHCSGLSMHFKIMRQGYYWPTMQKDAIAYSRKCDICQRLANVPHSPPSELIPMTTPWPFTVWGIDLIGQLPKCKGGVCYVVVAVDYFTKWAEAAPLAKITAKKIREFVFYRIICRFGIPAQLISDNGLQFASKELSSLCDEYHI